MTVMLAAERTAAPAVYAPPRRADALSLTEMTPADVWRFCEKLADTPLLPDQYRRQPASVLWAMEYGRALGLDVVTTISTIHVIKGKPSQSADLMLSRARAAGHRVRIQPGDGECTVSIFRADDPEFENRITWTYDDAVRAGLCTMRDSGPYSRSSKGEPQSWEKYPRAMLRARAISECVRMACPEVLHGAIYTPEELGAVIDQDGNPLPDAAPSFARQAPAQDQWEQATPAPVQQTPPEPTPAAAEPEQQQEDGDLSPEARQYLADAEGAETAAAFRVVRQAAERAGAPAPFLARLDRIGAAKVVTESSSVDPAPAEAGIARAAAAMQNLADPLPGSPDDPKARGLAVVELYAAGRDNSLTPGEVQQAFTDRYKHAVDAASLAELAEFTADLTAAAGTR